MIKIKRNKTKKRKQKKQKTTNQSQPKIKKRTPNLLDPAILPKNKLKKSKLIEKYHSTISMIAKILVIVIQVTYLFLLGYNSKLVSGVEILQDMVQEKEKTIHKEEEVTSEIIEIIKKTEKLKELRSSEIPLGEKLNKIIGYFPKGTVLTTSHIKNNQISMTIQTSNALDIALLISKYLTDDIAQKITLKSASLNNENTFTSELEMEFK